MLMLFKMLRFFFFFWGGKLRCFCCLELYDFVEVEIIFFQIGSHLHDLDHRLVPVEMILIGAAPLDLHHVIVRLVGPLHVHI